MSGEVDREFFSYPQDKILLPMAPVRIRGEDWKRHIPSCYLAELICALRSGGLYNGKHGQGSPPNWFPKSGKWSLRGFHNSSSGPNERKTDIVNLFFIPLVMNTLLGRLNRRKVDDLWPLVPSSVDLMGTLSHDDRLSGGDGQRRQ